MEEIQQVFTSRTFRSVKMKIGLQDSVMVYDSTAWNLSADEHTRFRTATFCMDKLKCKIQRCGNSTSNNSIICQTSTEKIVRYNK